MGLRVAGWSFFRIEGLAGWSFFRIERLRVVVELFRDSWSGGFLGILGLEEKMPSLTPHPRV
ncbi:hypothetical protein AAG906_008326 [Vitis piasezkii]